MAKYFTCFAFLLICSCASNSGVIPVGKNKYMISKQAATGFSAGDQLPEIVAQASQYCESINKNFELIKVYQNPGPYILGNFPKSDVQFMCLDNK